MSMNLSEMSLRNWKFKNGYLSEIYCIETNLDYILAKIESCKEYIRVVLFVNAVIFLCC